MDVQLLEEAPEAPPTETPLPKKQPPLKLITVARHSSETKAVGDDSERSDLHNRTFYDDNPNHPMHCMVGHGRRGRTIKKPHGMEQLPWGGKGLARPTGGEIRRQALGCQPPPSAL